MTDESARVRSLCMRQSGDAVMWCWMGNEVWSGCPGGRSLDPPRVYHWGHWGHWEPGRTPRPGRWCKWCWRWLTLLVWCVFGASGLAGLLPPSQCQWHAGACGRNSSARPWCWCWCWCPAPFIAVPALVLPIHVPCTVHPPAAPYSLRTPGACAVLMLTHSQPCR